MEGKRMVEKYQIVFQSKKLKLLLGNVKKVKIQRRTEQKGVESYRRENPGSKLQTAVTTEPSKLKKGSKSWKRQEVIL
jgi:hypothetical protein